MLKNAQKPEWLHTQNLNVTFGLPKLSPEIEVEFSEDDLNATLDRVISHAKQIAKGSSGDRKVNVDLTTSSELMDISLNLDVGCKKVSTEKDTVRQARNFNAYHMGFEYSEESKLYLTENRLVPTTVYLLSSNKSIRCQLTGEQGDTTELWLTPIEALQEIWDLIQYTKNQESYQLPSKTAGLVSAYKSNPPKGAADRAKIEASKQKLIESDKPSVDSVIKYILKMEVTTQIKKDLLNQYGLCGWHEDFTTELVSKANVGSYEELVESIKCLQ